MQTVLITGAGGFLAAHAAGALTTAGWRCIGISRRAPADCLPLVELHLADLRDLGAVTTILRREQPTVIVHLAAPSSVPASVEAPLPDLLAQVVPTATLFEAVRLASPGSRVLLISSAAVYGNPQQVPIAESAAPAPISPYGFHKLQQEAIADEYRLLFGVASTKARIFSTYGEGLRRLAVWEIARRALAGDFRVHGTGDEIRDFLYAGDVAEALLAIATNARFEGEVVNVASGHGVSIKELARALYALLGVDTPPHFEDDQMPGSPIHWRADVSVLRSMGYEPPRWSRGLPATVEWIRRSA